jgi:hypothetical protein
MRFRRSRPALIVAGILIFALAAGAAYAASANPDKASTADATRASAASGPSPKDFFHSAVILPGGCSTIATPPAGKALIVRQVRIDTYENPTPGTANNVILYVGTGGCDQLVGDVNPASIGLDTITFDPGLGIPAGSKLLAYQQGVSAEAYTDAYLVKANQVPPSTIVSPSSIPQQH